MRTLLRNLLNSIGIRTRARLPTARRRPGGPVARPGDAGRRVVEELALLAERKPARLAQRHWVK